MSESDRAIASREPHLLDSSKLSPAQKSDLRQFRFANRQDKEFLLRFTTNDCNAKWATLPQLAWVPVPTKAKMHSGKWSLEFHVKSIQKRQIGVGFLVDRNIGPDWRFFGYLGSLSSGWSYDPSTGDIVSATETIHGHQQKICRRRVPWYSSSLSFVNRTESDDQEFSAIRLKPSSTIGINGIKKCIHIII